MSNPCINCGKERINGKSWTQEAGISPVTHTLTVCPDPECQKKVDQVAFDRQAKSAMMADERAKSKLAREKSAAAAKLNNTP